MLGSAGLLILLVLPSPGMTASRQNAAADAVVKYSLALGIDAGSDSPDALHPSPAAAESWEQADILAWLSRQIEDESDEIGTPPAALRGYLASTSMDAPAG